METHPSLTPEQRQLVEQAGESPVELTDPQTRRTYVLLPLEVFREMRELFDEERQRAAIARKAKRNAALLIREP